MKVGILTFHRAHNYGAVLQSYALQEVLKRMGHDVHIIDYRQPYIEKIYKPYSVKRFFKRIINPRRFYLYILEIKDNIRRKKIFTSFVRQFLSLTQECDASHLPLDFDAYMIGSDQLWSEHAGIFPIDPVYSGDFLREMKQPVYAYAISSNEPFLNQIGKERLQMIARNFNTLSFREEAVCKLFKELTGLRPRLDIDPTLLADASIWNPLIDDSLKERKYILLYQVRGDSSVLKAKAKYLSQKESCELIDASDRKLSVETFVSLFKYAQCIITSSFHATAFSVIFHRPFYSYMLRDGKDERYVNLLRSLELEDQLVDCSFTPEVIPEMDYSASIHRIKTYRDTSLDYLKLINNQKERRTP